MREIRSGDFGEAGAGQGEAFDYKAERVGEMLVERVIWRELAEPRRLHGMIVADRGYIWFRFWLAQYWQVVERYYAPTGRLLGSKIDVCARPECDEAGCRARDLVLDLWIAADGTVTVYGEDAFEAAGRQAALSAQEVQYAEEHLRHLTAGIARGKFPPALVRNWQVDLQRLGLAAGPQPGNGHHAA